MLRNSIATSQQHSDFTHFACKDSGMLDDPFFRPDFYAFPKQPSSHLARNVGIFKRLVRCRTE